jgi:hypothetical protein
MVLMRAVLLNSSFLFVRFDRGLALVRNHFLDNLVSLRVSTPLLARILKEEAV